MQRDWELARTILIRLEEHKGPRNVEPNSFEGYESAIVSYHFHILDQAGLIEAICTQSTDSHMHCWAKALTWNGHEFLDSIKSDTVWASVKGAAKTKGLELSFDTIKAIAVAIAKSLLDL